MSFFYPKLDESTVKKLDVVRQLAQQHPGYFLESPYSGETEKLITDWFLSKRRPVTETGTSAATELTDDRDPWDMLYSESKELFLNLKQVKFSTDGDTSEKMSYFRTATSLLEKLVSLQERAMGLREIGEFQRAVMDVMESTLTSSQRTKVMEQLNANLSTSNQRENANQES